MSAKLVFKKTKICECCGEKFILKQKQPHQRFCSRKCSGKFGRGEPRGTFDKICECCGKLFKTPNQRPNQRFCSNSCSNKHTSTGRHPTKETVEKIRLSNTGKQRTKETIEKLRLSHIGKHLPEEQKIKIGISGRLAYSEGRTEPPKSSDCYEHGDFHSTRQNLDIYYQSSYELAALKIMEASPKSILTFIRGTVYRMPYEAEDGKVRTYFPDFYVRYSNGTEGLVEVGYVNDLNRKFCKILAAIDYCDERRWSFEVWCEISDNEIIEELSEVCTVRQMKQFVGK